MNRQVDAPREGLFKMREQRRGPWVPARIYRPVPIDPDTGEVIDRYPALAAECNGREIDPDQVWLFGREIDAKEWQWIKALAAIRAKWPSP